MAHHQHNNNNRSLSRLRAVPRILSSQIFHPLTNQWNLNQSRISSSLLIHLNLRNSYPPQTKEVSRTFYNLNKNKLHSHSQSPNLKDLLSFLINHSSFKLKIQYKIKLSFKSQRIHPPLFRNNNQYNSNSSTDRIPHLHRSKLNFLRATMIVFWFSCLNSRILLINQWK